MCPEDFLNVWDVCGECLESIYKIFREYFKRYGHMFQSVLYVFGYFPENIQNIL